MHDILLEYIFSISTIFNIFIKELKEFLNHNLHLASFIEYPVFITIMIRMFYILGSLFVLILYFFYPPLLEYGKTTTPTNTGNGIGTTNIKERKSTAHTVDKDTPIVHSDDDIGDKILTGFSNYYKSHSIGSDHSLRAKKPKTWNDISSFVMNKFVYKLRVPRSYFTHFYIVGVFFTLFCIVLDSSSGLSLSTENNSKKGVSIHNTRFHISKTAIFLMLVQTTRRLYECLFISKSNPAATMHIFHYLAGVLFYTLTPINIGICLQDTSYHRDNGLKDSDSSLLLTRTPDFHEEQPWVMIILNQPKTLICIVGFLACNYFQFQCHSYLASLKSKSKEEKKTSDRASFNNSNPIIDNKSHYHDNKKLIYVFPSEFKYVMTPHYTLEIIMYWLLSFLLNFEWTSVCCAIWVTIDLIIASEMQYRWYQMKFKEEFSNPSGSASYHHQEVNDNNNSIVSRRKPIRRKRLVPFIF